MRIRHYFCLILIFRMISVCYIERIQYITEGLLANVNLFWYHGYHGITVSSVSRSIFSIYRTIF